MGFGPLNQSMFQSYRALRYPNSTLVPIVVWVLTMISLPILGWILGENALIRGMTLGVLMQASAVIIILYSAWGWPRALKTVLIVAVFTYLAELLGSTTGFPFGKYHYTNLLQPQLAGVPVTHSTGLADDAAPCLGGQCDAATG